MHQEMGSLNESGLCMINISDRATPWTLDPSEMPINMSLPLVKVGHPFRLAHVDTSAYLKFTKSVNDVTCKQLPTKKKLPTSPNSLWVIEVDEPGMMNSPSSVHGTPPPPQLFLLTGLLGEILWNRPLHIKLYLTDLYLAICPSPSSKNAPGLDQEIGLVNARWRTTPQVRKAIIYSFCAYFFAGHLDA